MSIDYCGNLNRLGPGRSPLGVNCPPTLPTHIRRLVLKPLIGPCTCYRAEADDAKRSQLLYLRSMSCFVSMRHFSQTSLSSPLAQPCPIGNPKRKRRLTVSKVAPKAALPEVDLPCATRDSARAAGQGAVCLRISL